MTFTYTLYQWYYRYMDVTRMGTSELRAALGRRVDAAHFHGEPTIITSNGEPRGVLIPYADWVQLCEPANAQGGAR